MDSINKLKGMRANLVSELQANAESDDFSKQLNKKLEDSISAIDNQLAAAEKAREYSAKMARPETMGHNEHYEATYGFKNFGEYLRSVRNAGVTRQIDERLTKAPAGLQESDPSLGGFAVPPAFYASIVQKAYDESKILPRVFNVPIGDTSNGISIPLVDEISRQNGSRFGGITNQWLAEGAQINLSAPRFRLLDLKLCKNAMMFACTEELLSDAPAAAALAERGFALELQFLMEDVILRGDGIGKPKGILNSPARFVTPKEGSQTADTVTYNNLAQMYSHLWNGSLSSSVWLANQSIMPQLLQLQSGGSLAFPMWQAAGTADQAPKTYLFGRPLEFIEQASGLGDEGDISLLDLSQYVMISRGSQFASSAHLYFQTDQMAYRFVVRMDGNSLWATTLQPAYGTNILSPFITLQPR